MPSRKSIPAKPLCLQFAYDGFPNIDAAIAEKWPGFAIIGYVSGHHRHCFSHRHYRRARKEIEGWIGAAHGAEPIFTVKGRPQIGAHVVGRQVSGNDRF